MAISFQGIGTGVQTDQLVAAILAQEGQSVQRMVDKQAFNKMRTTALQSFRKGMDDLSTSLAAIQDRLNARTVTSTDTNSVYVSATASGAAAGNYDLNVAQVATRGRVVVDGVADPASTSTFDLANSSFAVQGTDGVTKTFTLTNYSLNGLRDAINASGAGVTAAIVNTGTGATPYQLVLSAKDTGTGTTTGLVSLASIDLADPTTTKTTDAPLGIKAGAITGTFAEPTGISGGLTNSLDLAKDAIFTLNGIQLTRKTNVVTDAADGITFTLKQGGQTGTTTLTVAQDKTIATSGLQDVIAKFNALKKIYKDASTSLKSSDGAIIKAPLAGDETVRSFLAQIQSALTGQLSGPSGGTTITSAASLGVSTGADGNLSLNVSTFQAALEKDPKAVQNLFTFNGSSSSGAVTLKESTSKTSTGAVTFNITSYVSGGAVAGTLTYGGTEYSLTGTNGTLTGEAGTPLEGLTISVLGTGTGTLNLTRGGGQAARDLVAQFTSPGVGGIQAALTNIENQNKALSEQVIQGQARLARRKIVLVAKFSKMETAVAQMKAAVGGLSGL
ncbi:MAG: hypothetical protein A3J24_04695 [Deltaproteobacteria bacterium RIFCSPLOWO2_02_FULL_53_8]|nr:MAG: hypothetical protein A3J24_04695 [Deltaproteobacteria bacterium RIFCSPLOWO2_02_FULL_53_8]